MHSIRPGPFLFSFFFPFLIAWLGNRAIAQTLKNLEGAVSVFGQFSGTSNGNGIQDSPTDSLGALATVRQSFHPWLGYEVNYSYTRFTERYSTIPFGVQNNLHEVSGAYLVQGPTLPILGLQPFGAVGVGALIFLPTTVGGQKYNQQTPRTAAVRVRCQLPHPHLAPRATAAISGSELQDAGLQRAATDYQRQAANL